MELVLELEIHHKMSMIKRAHSRYLQNQTRQFKDLKLQNKRDEWKHEKPKYRSRAQGSRVILHGIFVNI